MIVRNAARCDLPECGFVIESKHRHDFVECPCGNLFVDGGLSYTRRGWRVEGSWTELSEFSGDDAGV